MASPVINTSTQPWLPLRELFHQPGMSAIESVTNLPAPQHDASPRALPTKHWGECKHGMSGKSLIDNGHNSEARNGSDA